MRIAITRPVPPSIEQCELTHLARQQFVGFLCLLPLRDIKKNAKHQSVGNVRIIALAASGNPTNVAPG